MKKRIAFIAICLVVAICFATLVACNADINIQGNCKHVDKNNDEKCDLCRKSVVVSVKLFAINDLHGMYADSANQPGVDELTTYFKNSQKTTNTVILASGDMWQGSSESNNTKGALATEWLNYIDCASMTLGNHEFDWSTDKIKANARLAEFPFLAINVFDRATNKRVEYCDASVVVDFGEAKIGIIGAIGDCYSSISSSMCGDVYFKVGDDLTKLVQDESNRLRAQGVDYIVYSVHDGRGYGYSYSEKVPDRAMDWYDVSLSNGYVDMVFEGHTHQSYCYTDSYGVYHVQAGGYNKGISTATARINIANQKCKTSDVGVVRSDVYSACASDPIVDNLVEKYKDQIGNPSEVVALLPYGASGNTIADKVAELYCKKGLEIWGDKYDIVLGGGYIKTRSPYSLDGGEVTKSMVQTLLPFDNKIVLCALNGTQVNNKFIYSSNENYHIRFSEYGLNMKDKLLDTNYKNNTYYVVTDTYTSDYHHLSVIETLSDTVFARDLLCEYLKDGGIF